MTLTNEERETVINFNSAQSYAEVYTCQRSVKSKCIKAGYKVVKEDDVSTTFHCPIRCISFRNAKKRVKKAKEEEE